MLKVVLRTALTAAVLALGTPATAQTPGEYANLFVFGDSLVDSGNAQAARAAAGGADPAPAALGYFQGRFSNGFNFADYLSFGITGTPATASAYGGLNFSVGGAQATEVAGDASPSFVEQIAAFRTSGFSFSPDSLVLVTLGGNDVRAELAKIGANPTTYRPDLAPAVAAMTDGLTALYGLGARNFLVTGLPDVGQIPAVTQFNSPALSAAGRQLSFGLNTAFGQLTAGFARQTGANAQFFDLFGYQQAIYANPTAYGLATPLNTRDACIGTAASPQCEGYVYFDPIHPTTQLHRAVAGGIAAQLGITAVPEPATWATMVIGVGVTGGALRRRRRRLVAAAA